MSQTPQSSAPKPLKSPADLPSAFDHFQELLDWVKQGGVLCLDYDGTLTPIVENPANARITDEMRAQVKAVAERMPVAIVSGRGLPFIQQQMQLEEVYYAGSHGFEIRGPGGFQHEQEEAQRLLPLLDEVEAALKRELQAIKGAEVERKKYGIAVHYRKVATEQVPDVKQRVAKLLSQHPDLKGGKGKMVLELKPNIDWHKGRAVHFIANRIAQSKAVPAILYLGDDLTDEDAFQVIDKGAGLLVGAHDEDSAADYRLENVEAVQRFLQQLTDHLQ